MNNSVYDKTIENLRKSADVRLVRDTKSYKKFVSRATFVYQKIFGKNLLCIHEIKPVWTLNKPIYVGCSILDLRKLLMYDFHYNYINDKYGHKVKLLFINTGSLLYEIETDDLYEDLYWDKDLFDFCEDSKFYDPTNQNMIGKMLDDKRNSY